MKICCKKSVFQASLKRANLVKGTNPMYGLTKIEVDQYSVGITKCSEIMQISDWFVADESKEGSVVIDGDLLSQVVGALEGDIELERADDKLIVRNEHKVFTLSILTDEFPFEIDGPSDNKAVAVIPIKEFRKIEAVYSSVSNDMRRVALSGVLLSKGGDILTTVGTDGTVLAISRIDYDPGMSFDNFDIILPLKGGLEILTKIMSTTEEENISLIPSVDSVWFTVDKCNIIIKTINGKFPDYSQIIPEEYEHTITGATNVFKKAIKSAMIINPEIIQIAILPASMRVSASSTIIGESEYFEYVEIQNGSAVHTLKLNPEKIVKFFRNLGERTKMRFDANKFTPINITSEENGYCELYLMPMRSNDLPTMG